MLDASDVEVDRGPVVHRRRTERRGLVVRVAEAVEVPRGVDERVHRVGLPPRRPATGRTARRHELRHLCERGVAAPGEGLDVGKLDRQVLVRRRADPARVAVDDRDRRTPVALPRDAPVLQPVLDLAAADAPGFRGPRHGRDGFGARQPGELTRRDHGPRRRRGGLQRLPRQLRAVRLDDDAHRQPVLARELEVALVVGRHRHDRHRFRSRRGRSSRPRSGRPRP